VDDARAGWALWTTNNGPNGWYSPGKVSDLRFCPYREKWFVQQGLGPGAFGCR
jgi:hypothetical protein